MRVIKQKTFSKYMADNTRAIIGKSRSIYEAETGKYLDCNLGLINIAKVISGELLSKKDAKKYLKNYIHNYNKVTNVKREKYSIAKAQELYKSKEWRSLRVNIIEDQKGRCQMCGRSYKDHGVVIHVDHIIPLSIDWSKRLDKNNLQLLCEDCNLGKGNHYKTDWRS